MRKTILSGAIAALVFGLAIAAARPAQASQIVRCESRHGEAQRCKVDTSGGVILERQLSSAGCWHGDTWGWDRRGIWVRNGCRADFRVGSEHHTQSGNSNAAAAAIALGVIAAAAIVSHKRDRDREEWGGSGGSYYPPSYPPYALTIDCRSFRYRYVRCPVDIRRGYVEIIRQYSSTRCQHGRNWGYDRTGIWVDDGCQAEFAVYR